MQVRMSDEETKLVHELVQDALIDEVHNSQDSSTEGRLVLKTQTLREIMLGRLEKKLR